MNLQTLSTIDLPTLSRIELARLARAVREAWGKAVDLRSTAPVLLEYVESYKNVLALEVAQVETESEDSSSVATEEDAIVVFHQKSPLFHCPDGAVAGIIAKNALEAIGMEVRLLPGMHSNNEELLKDLNASTAKWIYMVDYAMPPSMMEQIKGKKVIIIDHHKGIQEDYCKAGLLSKVSRVSSGLAAYFNNRKSGARLVWEYFNRESSIPFLVQYVEAGDLYTFDLPYAKEVCAGIYHAHLGAGKTLKQIEQSLLPSWEMAEDEFIAHYRELGEEAGKERKKRIEKLAKKACVTTIFGRKAVAVEVLPTDLDIVSALCYSLYSKDWFKENNLRFVAAYNYAEGKCFVSLRSDGYDCLPVAKHFGGNGHPQACGFSVNDFEECIDRPSAY